MYNIANMNECMGGCDAAPSFINTACNTTLNKRIYWQIISNILSILNTFDAFFATVKPLIPGAPIPKS